MNSICVFFNVTLKLGLANRSVQEKQLLGDVQF